MKHMQLYAAGSLLAVAALSTALTPRLLGQTVAPPNANTEVTPPDEVVMLSPFVVDSSQDKGSYLATSTLAGTRVKTDLKDIASSLTVVPAQFLRDTGATNNQTLLVYTTNTEVGGVYGNYGGVGNTFIEGISEPNQVNPNQNTRVRGLDSADNTRDYFLSDIPWDSFDVGRIDLQRGPNSILFGIGSPAGIINASINTAGFKNSATIENRVGSYGSFRDSLDFNYVLLENELAIRVAALDDHTMYQQKPAYNHDKRIFGALRWDPKFFSSDSAHTTIRATIEDGKVDANRPRILPPADMITPFFTAANKTALDSYYASLAGINVNTSGSNVVAPGETPDYYLNQNGAGGGVGSGTMFYYDNLSQAPGASIRATEGAPGGSGATTFFAINSSGGRDSQIDGLPFSRGVALTGYGQMAITAHQNNPALFPAADKGFYKQTYITDPSIFDFYNNLIDGPNSRQWQDWNAFNLSVEQTFFNNRLGLQMVYDHQDYRDGQESNLGNPYISVDMYANTQQTLPWAYGNVAKYNGTGTAGTNPNAGRAFIGDAGSGSGSSNVTARNNFRATLTGELRATDFLKDSWLSSVLGRHVFTGMFSNEDYDQETRSWMRYALDGSYDNQLGFGPGVDGTGFKPLSNNSRQIGTQIYVSAPLFGASSAAGLNIQPLTTVISPIGNANITYFDSHWAKPTDPAAPGYVNPAATWTNPTVLLDVAGATQASTQSENPANYAGWKNGSFPILNADNGDINDLYTNGGKIRKATTSKAFTWQSFLWDDTVAGTWGWRQDTLEQRAGNALFSPTTGAADMNYGLDAGGSKGKFTQRSWGVVLHEPKMLRNKLPWGTNISLIYDDANNQRVEHRVDFDGNTLPDAKGHTKDYGFAINTLQDRLQLKVTWYKTQVTDANLSSVLSSESTLGSNAYEAYYHIAWGLGDVLESMAGMKGDHQADGSAYLWNWAANAHPGQPIYNDVTSSAFKNDPQTVSENAAIAAWQQYLPTYFPQSWFNAYGFPVNVAAVVAGDYHNAVAGWTVADGNWNIRPSGGGNINGVAPVGTVNNESKGIEFELTGQVTKNLKVSVNASKQKASESALGTALTTFIERTNAFYATPAGDIRLWSAGDQSLRAYFQQGIYAAYQFQLQTTGKMVPEMAPWRVNAVADYSFDKGILKGSYVGGGYRWQDGEILGYGLNSTQDNLDVNKPFWGKSTYAVDFWAGYKRKLTSKIDWNIQINLRNVDSKSHLELLSVQPDGGMGAVRIVEGQAWELTNTFSF